MLLESLQNTTHFFENLKEIEPVLFILGTIVYIGTSVISAVISSHLARQTAKNKLAIKFYKESIEKLYLKLYFYVYYLTDFSSYTPEQTQAFFNDINKLIQKNPIYSSSTLNSLMFQFYNKMTHQKNCSMIMANIKQCIVDEYNRLKRRLNYPTSTFWDYFKYSLSHLSKVGLLTLIAFYAFDLLFLSFVIICSNYKSPGILQKLLFIIFGTLAILCFGAFIIFFISLIILLIKVGISSFIIPHFKKIKSKKRTKPKQKFKKNYKKETNNE